MDNTIPSLNNLYQLQDLIEFKYGDWRDQCSQISLPAMINNPEYCFYESMENSKQFCSIENLVCSFLKSRTNRFYKSNF